MKLVITDGYCENPGDLSWEPLKQFGELVIYDRTEDDEDKIIDRIGDADIAIINKVPITERIMDACPNLKAIAILATGYNVVDYTYYTFRVDYSEVLKDTLPSDVTESTMTAEQKTQVLEAYKAAIADAKAKADAMKAAATAEEFMTLLLNHAADKAWKDVYTAQTVADADKPSDEDLAAIKSALIADVLGEIAENKEKADAAVTVEEGATSVTVYEKTVTAAFVQNSAE